MKAYPIEDTIIAYFDELRQMAVRAARNISIPPELEEAVFDRVAALQEEERLPVGFWSLRRMAMTAGVAAIFIAGIVGSFEFQSAGANSAASANVKNLGISIQHTVANAMFENMQGAEHPLQPVSRTAIMPGNSEIPEDKLAAANDS